MISLYVNQLFIESFKIHQIIGNLLYHWIPHVSHQTTSKILFGMITLIISIPYGIYWRYIMRTQPLGCAHFANIFDLNRSDLLQQEGICLGHTFYGPLRHTGFEPILCIGGTGGGKTSAFVIPNVLELKYDSLIITDIKGEIFELTGRYRQKIGDVYIFDPENPNTTPYNPFELIRIDTFYEDLDLIFSVLIPESKEPIWSMGSRSIAATLVCMMNTTQQKPTLFAVYQALCRPDLREEIAQFYELNTLNPQLKALCGKCLSVREEQFKDLSLQAQEYLSCFNQPNLSKATNSNAFNFHLLREKIQTIYIKMPANTETYGPICALFFEQLFQHSSQENNPDLSKKSITCFIDEFANLPRIPSIIKGINYLRSYRIRICLFIQHTAQLAHVYGIINKENFLAMPIKVIFNISSKEDADYFSRYCGSTTIEIKNKSEQQGRYSMQYQHQNVPLIRPDELQRLSKKYSLILKTGFVPVKSKKNFWFLHRKYRKLI
ncbi:MAG: type IV secretory system conjugative DNA transfer family protein [Endozoicomonadaceae bacterium]|nr:type IV secretory system conjugative DNA transfer family protein [Endozoicomonadaceae bacterium]